MSRRLKIAVADDDAVTRELLSRALSQMGHHVITVADSPDFVVVCQSPDIDLVFIDISSSHLGGLQMVESIYQRHPVPVIVISTDLQPEDLDRARSNHVFGCLIKPINEAELVPAIEVAQGRFAEIQILREELQKLRQELHDRKVIERAKGILMRQARIDEEAAFLHLQKLARNKSKKLVEIAEIIVTAQKAMDSAKT